MCILGCCKNALHDNTDIYKTELHLAALCTMMRQSVCHGIVRSWHSQVTYPFRSDASGDTAIMVDALRDCLQTLLDAATAAAFKLYHAACVADPSQGFLLCSMLRQRMSLGSNKDKLSVQCSIPCLWVMIYNKKYGCINVIA